jgi:hypothetical protein
MQTSPDLRNSDIPDSPAQVCTEHANDHLYIYVYTRESGWNPNPSTKEHDRRQHDSTATSVIAQQYSSKPLSQLPFHSCTEKFGENRTNFFFNLEFLLACEIFRKATVVFVMLVRLYVPACNNSACTGQIFIQFDTWGSTENLPRKFKIHYNMSRTTGTLHADRFTFMITHESSWFLPRMRNISDKNYGENQNTHFDQQSRPGNRVVYETM